jgi:hypothetical protein
MMISSERSVSGIVAQPPQSIANFLKSLKGARPVDDPFEEGKEAAARIMATVEEDRRAAD